MSYFEMISEKTGSIFSKIRTISSLLMARDVIGYIMLISLLIYPMQGHAQNKSYANDSYNDLVKAFWRGSATGGRFVNLQQERVKANSDEEGLKFMPGSLWQYSMAANVIYSYWKETGSVDAADRMKAWWTKVQSEITLEDLGKCGVGTVNTASDDSAWDILFFLEVYEVTKDPKALKTAKGLLDCAWNRWSDHGDAGCIGTGAAVGSGIWYSDKCDVKSSYQNAYTLGAYWYYQISHDSLYRTRSIKLDDWVSENLLRNGQIVQGKRFPDDGLYWADMKNNGEINGVERPYQIKPLSSVVLLAGDMAQAVLDARLYTETHDPIYLARLQKTARGIQTYHRAENAVVVSNRDTRVDGMFAFLYAKEVVPLLRDHMSFDANAIRMLAESIHAKDRLSDGTYSGSWTGPADGQDPWCISPHPTCPRQIEVSANAAIWGLAAAALH